MEIFTVEIQAGSEDHNLWQALAPAETVRGESAADVAREVARNQDVATGPGPWRVVVWDGDLTGGGHSAPRATEAAYVLDYPDVAREITWTAIGAAGIPLLSTHHHYGRSSGITSDGQYEALSTDGQRRAVFGPQLDPQGVCQAGEHPGWAMAPYGRATDVGPDEDPWDAAEAHEWFWYEPDALDEMLAAVKRHLEQG